MSIKCANAHIIPFSNCFLSVFRTNIKKTTINHALMVVFC